MRYLSVCSGIEAATVAWHPLGFLPLAFSEIDPFARAVLAHHYPDVPLHGDFTALRDEPWTVDADLLVGGTPCQAFSVAGLRNSLADDPPQRTSQKFRTLALVKPFQERLRISLRHLATGRSPKQCVDFVFCHAVLIG